MQAFPLSADNPWFHDDPWVDMAVVRVSRDTIVRKAVVNALKISPDLEGITLDRLPESTSHQIETIHGLTGELAETALAYHLYKLRVVQSRQSSPFVSQDGELGL